MFIVSLIYKQTKTPTIEKMIVKNKMVNKYTKLEKELMIDGLSKLYNNIYNNTYTKRSKKMQNELDVINNLLKNLRK